MGLLRGMAWVSIAVRDPAKAEEFYVRLLGLRAAERSPDAGWLAVEPRGGGTRIALLVPDPGQPRYEELKAQVGGQTGIAFAVGDLKATLEQLQHRGVAIPWASLDPKGQGGIHATIEDQDGNILMLFQPVAKPQGAPGLDRVAFVNVVVQEQKAAEEFYRTSLGMSQGARDDALAWSEMRAGAKGAGLGLLQPVEETYQEPADFQADMGHLGEPTGIAFLVADLDDALAEARSRGVRVPRSADALPLGGRSADIEDPDGNSFLLVEDAARLRAWEGKAARAKPKAAKAKPKARAKPKAAMAKPAKAKPKAAKKPAARRGAAKARKARR